MLLNDNGTTREMTDEEIEKFNEGRNENPPVGAEE